MRNVVLTILIVLALVFGMQNTTVVTLNFVVWHVDAMVAIAIIVALALGVLIGILLLLPWGLRARRDAKGSRRRVGELERAHSEASPILAKQPVDVAAPTEIGGQP